MEAYRNTIKRRITVGLAFILVVIAILVYDSFFAETGALEDHIASFQMGMLAGIAFVALFFVIQGRQLLKDERKLQLEYNKEHDERMQAIQAKAGLPMIIYTSALMIIIASLIARSYPGAFIPLVVAGMIQLVIALITKAILMKKM